MEVFVLELRTASSPLDVKNYDTERLRSEFLIDDLFQPDQVKMVYSHIDRIITGSAVPVTKALTLDAGEELRADYFLERRELGIINIGGAEVVLQEIVDGVMPCLLPLLLVFACYKALQKKVSGTVIMIALMVFGVIGSMIGLL